MITRSRLPRWLRLPSPTLRTLFWNALVAAILAILGQAVALRMMYIFKVKKYTLDSVGECHRCHYQPLPFPLAWWTCTYRLAGTGIALAIIYALVAGEAYLCARDRVLRDSGRRPGTWTRPLISAGDAPPRSPSRDRPYGKWAAAAALIIGAELWGFDAALKGVEVQDRLPAGISLPLGAMNQTMFRGGIIGNYTPGVTDPCEIMTVSNPTVAYRELYPHDRIDVPEGWQESSLYLTAEHLPLLEKYLRQSLDMTARILARAPELRHVLKLFKPPAVTANESAGIQLGDTVYGRTATDGIDFNMTTYQHFVGDGAMGLPRQYRFEEMFGQAWADHVNVTCKTIGWTDGNRTDSWPSRTVREAGVAEDALRIFTTFGLQRSPCGSDDTPPLEPSHDFLLWQGDDSTGNGATVRCFYSTLEYHMVFRAWPGTTIFNLPRVRDELTGEVRKPKHISELDIKCLSPLYALPAARAIHELLTQDTLDEAGVLVEALREYGITTLGSNHIRQGLMRMRITKMLERVLSETAMAYISLLRQRIERADAWVMEEQMSHPDMKLKGLILHVMRIGGASRFAIAGIFVTALLGSMTAISLLRTCMAGGVAFPGDAVYCEARHTSMEVSPEKANDEDERALKPS